MGGAEGSSLEYACAPRVQMHAGYLGRRCPSGGAVSRMRVSERISERGCRQSLSPAAKAMLPDG
jgi:hypothetical protein